MKTWKHFDFKIDNAAGTIADITSYTNSGQAGGGMFRGIPHELVPNRVGLLKCSSRES